MNPSSNEKSSELANIIKTDAKHSRRAWIIIVIAAIILVAATLAWLGLRSRSRAASAPPPYITETLNRGNLTLDIIATGNLEPTNQVTIGSELSGTVLEVYADINDRVIKGQPLAMLDTTRLVQQTQASRAALAASKAQLAQAQATLVENKATLARQQELHRLSEGRVPSGAEMEAAQAAADRAAADILAAQAGIDQNQAQLDINETELSKAVIRSPIDGIVLTRSVEPGQTVAASFTAPELFVIAENLEQMKLNVAIAEADIGRVAAGQNSTFTVDAWPTRTYTATVTRVSFGSSITDNVVTYQTELKVTNDDLSLRPGMTATASIRVAEAQNVYLAPVAAFRFSPADAAAPGPAVQSKTFTQSIIPMPGRRRTAGGASNGASQSASADGTARIYILRDGRPEPITVNVGLSDGRQTEVTADALSEGMQVITFAR